MYLRFRVVTPDTPAAPCNDTLSLVAYGATTITIKNDGITVASGLISAVVPIGATTITDTNGNEIAFSAALTNNVITCSIALANVWDSANLEITLSNATYNTYKTNFVVYGYDIGNDTVGGVTLNQNFDIVLTTVADAMPYSGVISYRKPFTNKIHFYRNNSSTFSSLGLYDELDALVSNLSFGTLCYEEDKEFYYITQTTTDICQQSVNTEVDEIQWLPDFEISSDCTANCVDDCVTPLSTNTMSIAVDYATLGTVYIDDSQAYPYVGQGFDFYMYNIGGIVVAEEHTINNIGYGDTAANYTFTSGVFSIPIGGDYIIKGCLSVFGYEPQGIYDDTQPLIADDYYMINNILAATDFTNASTPSNPGALADVFKSNAALPTDWSTKGKLLPCEVIGSPTSGKYYKIIDYSDSPDFTNLVTTDVAGTLLNMMFYSDGTAPTLWGTLAVPLIYAPDYLGATIVETLPIYTCCQIITLTGCDTYDVTQTTCDTINVVNNSLVALSYTISMLGDSGWTVIVSDSVPAASTEDVEITTDGVYVVTIGDDNFVKLVTCDMEACKLMYINELTCCNAGTNCDPCNDCSTVDNYNFNAFSILMQSYFMLVNREVNINYLYSTVELTTAAVLSNLYSISELITQAVKYCEVCDEPCSNCN